jgi:MoaA/NifB/PqqE/SkfB family radical SAM enzyme
MDLKQNPLALIERVCFNFQDKCNMNCPYCYIPFTRERVELDRCIAVVKRCAELGVKVITFGGGDPFLLSGFSELLKQTANLGIEIHIDTNGTRLSNKDYNLVEETTSLIALPLDGPNGEIHAAMRESGDHFQVVLRHLEILRNRTIKVKINTVVSSLNYQSIIEIGEILKSYRINIWSLYQFWPLHNARFEKNKYNLPDAFFDNLIKEILTSKNPFRIEPGPIRERYGTYLFVSHTGSLYTHDQNSTSEYKVLGSIFDDSTIELWQQLHGHSIREQARTRYISFRSNSK